MAAITGQLQTFNAPNYLGELFHLTPTETPFLSMIGGLNGGEGIADNQWSWQGDDNVNAAQDTKVEGADATFAGRSRAMFSNVVQIHQEGVEVSYTKQATVNKLADAALSGITQSALLSIQGAQPVQNEMSRQLMLKIMKIARDVEYSFINGVFAQPVTNATARATRGILAAITGNGVAGTNVDATGATNIRTQFNTLLRGMVGDTSRGAPLRQAVIFAGALVRQQLTNAYGYAPESRNVGGLNIQQIETDFATMGIVFDRFMPAQTLAVIELSVCKPKFLAIPGKGLFFTEPLAKTGSAEKMQIYGEIGLEYGPPDWHGRIFNIPTSINL